MPVNFYLVVVAQFVVFLLFVFFAKDKGRPVRSILLRSIAFGIPLGIAFDLLCGVLEIHTYLPLVVHTDPFCDCGLTFAELLWNGALSYGTAIATAYYLTRPAFPITNMQTRKLFTLITSVIICIAVCITLLAEKHSMTVLFACGFVVVGAGELLLLLRGMAGPILSPFVNGDFQSLAFLWLKVTWIAIAYEVANHYFPVWSWLPGSAYDSIHIEQVIIVFGYAGLFHSMIVFWQLTGLHSRKNVVS